VVEPLLDEGIRSLFPRVPPQVSLRYSGQHVGWISSRIPLDLTVPFVGFWIETTVSCLLVAT
jgi:hypothetical protein